MQIPENVVKEIEQFNKACDEFQASKIILIDKSISAILKCVAKGGAIYSSLARQVVGYNFAFDFKNFEKSGSVDSIMAEHNISAFAFCLLNEIDNGNIDALKLLKGIYGKDEVVAYEKFSVNIIENFRREVISLITSAYDNKDEFICGEQKQRTVVDGDLVKRAGFVSNNIVVKLRSDKMANFKLKNIALQIAISVGVCISNEEQIGILGLLLGLRMIIQRKRRFFKEDLVELNKVIDALEKV